MKEDVGEGLYLVLVHFLLLESAAVVAPKYEFGTTADEYVCCDYSDATSQQISQYQDRIVKWLSIMLPAAKSLYNAVYNRNQVH